MGNTTGLVLRGDLALVIEEAKNAETLLIAQKVMPSFPVAVKSGQYPKLQIAEAELLSADVTERRPGASYGEVTDTWDYGTYDTVDRGVKRAVDDTEKKDMGRYFGVEAGVSRRLLRRMMLASEIRVAAATMNATNYGAGTNSSTAYNLSTDTNIATVDLPLDVQSAIARVSAKGETANAIVMGYTLWSHLRRCTKTINWVRGSTGAGSTVTASSFAASFKDLGIENVYVGNANYNTAKKGVTTAVLSEIWGTTYIWVGNINPGPSSLQDPGVSGVTLVWNEEGGLYVTESYRDEDRRSDMIRVRQHTIEKCINGNAGTLITSQYS